MLLSLLSLTSKWLFRLAWSESQLKKTIVRFSFSEFRGVKDELFTKIFNDWKPTIFAKRSILDVWQGFDYAAGQDKKYIRTQIVDWNFLKTGRVTFLITPGHVHSVLLVIVANYFNTTYFNNSLKISEGQIFDYTPFRFLCVFSGMAKLIEAIWS